MHEDIAVERRMQWRDVYEVETHSVAHEVHRQRPGGLVVVVAEYDADWPSQLLELSQDLGIAHVAEMPDFVS
jgi:hypothetical protein